MNEIINNIISNPWIGVIGIAVGLVGILVTILVAIKQKEYPTWLSFYSNKTINLYKSLSIPFSKINITYDNNRIDKNIIYTSGYFLCEGQKDISNNIEPISIELPIGNKWLDIKVSSHIPALNDDLSINYNDNIAELKFTKLKRGEIIFFQSILESDNSEINVLDSINFTHRIDNTERIIKKKSDIYNLLFSSVIFQFFFRVLLIITILITMTAVGISFFDPVIVCIIASILMTFVFYQALYKIYRNIKIRKDNNINYY